MILASKVNHHSFSSSESVTPNKYADSLELAVKDYLKWLQFAPQYEKQVEAFNNRLINSFKINRLRLQELGLSKYERNARIKANHKIRPMIVIAESELKKLKESRIEKLQIDISEKFKVNLFTLKKLL